MRSLGWEPRTYRRVHDPEDLVSFEVTLRETDLHISAVSNLGTAAAALVADVRADLEGYIRLHPRFAESYVPIDVAESAPPIVVEMADAAQAAGVGPMAAVAGAVAEYVARGLAVHSGEIIVENGGDVYLMGERERALALWAGEGGAGGIGLVIDGAQLPLAVCTSSGRIGHSASFGSADAVTVLAAHGALADAVATATANRVRCADDVERALEFARGIEGVLGLVVTVDGHVGAWGQVRLAPLDAI